VKGNRLSLTILVVVVVILGIYGWSHRDIFSAIVAVRWPFLLYLLFMWVPSMLISGLRTKIFLDFFKIDLRFREWFGLSIITNMTNYLTPLQGGAAMRAIYLKKEHGFSYSAFATLLLASYVLSFLVTGMMGMAVVGALYLKYGAFDLKIFLLFLAVFLIVITFIILSPSILPTQNRFKNTLRNVLEGWRRIKSDWGLLYKISLLIGVGAVMTGVRLYLGYKALSLNADFLPVLLLGIVSQYTIFIKITPGNLGIFEGVIALVSGIVGIGFDEGLAVATLLRGVNMVMVFTLGPLFSYLLTRELKYEGSDG